MKKVISIVTICMLSIAALGQVTFGIKAGANFSGLSTAFVDGRMGWIGGVHAGGYANYSFNKVLGVQAEAVFSMQGGKYKGMLKDGIDIADGHGNVIKIDGMQRMNYINIPILLDIKPLHVPLSVFIGPQFGYCVNRSDSDGFEVSDNRDFDFGAVLGVQYTFIEHLTVGLRYNLGFIPNYVYNDYKAQIENHIIISRGLRNNVAQLSVGWTF